MCIGSWASLCGGLTCFLYAACIAGAGRAEDSLFAARVFQNAEGQKLPYRLLVPENYDAKKSYPLVLFLHGAGERGDDNTAQLVHLVGLFAAPENRAKYPCFVVAPQAPLRLRWRLPTRKIVFHLIASLEKEYNIDRQRKYIMGLSMGGYATWTFIAENPDMFAAAIPICGGGNPYAAPRLVKLPIWAFHGAQDEVVPVKRTRDMIEALQAAGGAPRYTEYPDCDHASWRLAAKEPDFLPWLFAQKRAENATPTAAKETAPAAPPKN